jgi:DNA segregation ATPase FtsK/SpoIIIE-like protein
MNWSNRDPLLKDAARIILEHDNASASFLQRKMSLGYARAAQILDQLQFLGIIGPADGAKPRKILITEVSQIEALTQPRTLTHEELQEKVQELEMKVEKITTALQGLSLSVSDNEDDDMDELFEEASKLAKENNGKLTASELQRKLNIGYARAARILDELRGEEVIG